MSDMSADQGYVESHRLQGSPVDDPHRSPTEGSAIAGSTAAQTEDTTSAAQKRPAPSPPTEDVPPSSPKRARLSDAGNGQNSRTRSPTDTRDVKEADKRLGVSQEEKKRGRRLFGGLLSTLSQTTTSSQQKKRQEIERRQQAKAHQRRAEDEKYREEKLAKLRAVRQVEQIKFEDQAVR
jgi:hypothetical protein